MPESNHRICPVCNATIPNETFGVRIYCSVACYTVAQKRRKMKRRELGLCVCGRPAIRGFTVCLVCSAYNSKRAKADKLRRDQLGLCYGCNNLRAEGFKYCLPCKELQAKGRVTRKRRVKQVVIEAYGGACECCGETLETLLTIDHIDGHGAAHRKELGSTAAFYTHRYLIREGFPKDNFRLLCLNCNIGRHWNRGVCPHEEARQGLWKQHQGEREDVANRRD